MPVNPYTWQTNDFVTAYRLNSELRQTNGNPFLTNGPGFHSRRPVFKSQMITSPTSPGAGVVAYIRNASNQWLNVADTSSFVGAKLDGPGQQLLGGRQIPNGETPGSSNQAPIAGGLFILTGNIPWGASATANSYRIGSASWTSGAGTQIQQGCAQPSNSGVGNSPWFLDLIDTGVASFTSYTMWYQNSVGSIGFGSANQDGSGEQARMAGFWASQTQGTKLSVLPSIPPNYTSTTPVASSDLNTYIRQAMYLMNMPPALKVVASTSTSLTANTAGTIAYSAAGSIDTYSGLTTGASAHYTTPLAGLYLVYACTAFAGAPASGTQVKTGISINGGSAIWGPSSQSNGTAGLNTVKVGVHNLAAGTTITQVAQMSATGTTNGNSGTSSSYLVILYLGPAASPGTLPNVPDTTYLFKAGTPPSAAPGILNSYFVNDIAFLMQRPYLLAVQNTAQTGISGAGTGTTGTIIHMDGTPSDNYAGWTSGASNLYTAQRAGWYLAVHETQMAAPSLTVSPANMVGFQLSPQGVHAYDWYQIQNSYTGAGGGGAAVGLYYLRVGDTIAPCINSLNTSSTTTSTITGAATPTHFECVWISS